MVCLPDIRYFRSRASKRIFLWNILGYVPCFLQLVKCRALMPGYPFLCHWSFSRFPERKHPQFKKYLDWVYYIWYSFKNIIGEKGGAGYQHFRVPQHCCLKIFSSTGRRPASYCHGVGTSCVRPSVRSSVRASVNFFFKKLLLRNYWLDFNQISQECSLGGPLSNSFK